MYISSNVDTNINSFFCYSRLVLVVQRMDDVIHQINHDLVDSIACFGNTFDSLDRDLVKSVKCHMNN